MNIILRFSNCFEVKFDSYTQPAEQQQQCLQTFLEQGRPLQGDANCFSLIRTVFYQFLVFSLSIAIFSPTESRVRKRSFEFGKKINFKIWQNIIQT